MSLEPSMNSTVPVGVPAPGLVTDTVAVNVTDWPKTDGLGAETSPVDVDALSTSWLTGLLWLPSYVPSLTYSAVIECPELTDSPPVEIVADVTPPTVLSVPIPIGVPPS